MHQVYFESKQKNYIETSNTITTWHIPQGQVLNNLLRHGGLWMNRRRLGTSDEEGGPIYGLRWLLTNSKQWMDQEVCQTWLVDLLRYPIPVVRGECHQLKVVRWDCKRPIEAPDFHSVVRYGQKYFRPCWKFEGGRVYK